MYFVRAVLLLTAVYLAITANLHVTNILTKSYGTSNAITLVKATFDALSKLRTRQEIERLRGVSLS